MMRLPFRRMQVVGLVAALLVCSGWAQTPNYVRTSTYYDAAKPAEASVVTGYSDGLGRTVQTRIDDVENSNPGVYARVSSVQYDDAGRPVKAILPFPTTTAGFLPGDLTGTASDYYRINVTNTTGEVAYSETQYKADPLGRVSASSIPGVQYVIKADPNATDDHCTRTWYLGTAMITLPATPPAGFDAEGLITKTSLTVNNLTTWEATCQFTTPTHYLTVTRDANGVFSQTITDAFGRVVKTCTSNIMSTIQYDIVGNVLAQNPPHETTSRTVAATAMATTCLYNTLGQVYQKTTPDAGTVKYQYDAAGRLWVVQDARQSTDPYKYTVYLYDALGRVAAVGLNSRLVSFNDVPWDEVGPRYIDQWTNNMYPRVRNIYDDATVVGTVLNASATITQMALTNLQGRLAASISYDESNVCLSTAPDFATHVAVDVYSYDEEGRVDRVFKRLPGMKTFSMIARSYNLQGELVLEKVYDDFMGSVVRAKNVAYDRHGRPTTVYKDQNAVAANALTGYSYYKHGPMGFKNFWNSGGTWALSQQAYFYNAPGWLRQMTSNKFSEDLYHNGLTEEPNVLKNEYTGNIAKAVYTQATETGTPPTIVETDKYLYDDLSRLTNLTSVENASYTESFSYKNDGRIAFKRKSGDGTGHRDYTYIDSNNKNSNRLQQVSAGPSNPTARKYAYDPNGNMIFDDSKNMVIYYDWRNMPYSFRLYKRTATITDAYTTLTTPQLVETKLLAVGATFESEVKMLYDAGGNRVVKSTYDR